MKNMTRVYVDAVVLALEILSPGLATNVSLDVASATMSMYSKLLSEVRDNVKDMKLKYGKVNVPVMGAPSNPVKYLLVNLKASEGGTITVGVSKNNLYVRSKIS